MYIQYIHISYAVHLSYNLKIDLTYYIWKPRNMRLMNTICTILESLFSPWGGYEYFYIEDIPCSFGH